MFVQNFIELSAAVRELSWSQGKKSDENNTVGRCTVDSNNTVMWSQCCKHSRQREWACPRASANQRQ